MGKFKRAYVILHIIVIIVVFMLSVAVISVLMPSCRKHVQSTVTVSRMYWTPVTEDIEGNAAIPTGYEVVCIKNKLLTNTDVGNVLEVPLAVVMPDDGVYECTVSAYDNNRGGLSSTPVIVHRARGIFYK